MTEFSRLLAYLRPYRTIFALSIVLMIATGLLEGATGLLLVPIFDKFAGAGKAASGLLDFSRYLPTSGIETLSLIALLLVLFTLAKGVAEYFSSYLMSHIGQSVIADVRASLYDHIIRQSA